MSNPIKYTSAHGGRTIEHDDFMQIWENSLPALSDVEIDHWLGYASPLHPKQNMRWLYDRLLTEKAMRSSGVI
jgi:hypothetical protein